MNSRHRVGALLVALVLILAPNKAVAQSVSAVVSKCQPRMVKVYGSGGYRSLEGYQSGFFASEDGLVVTAWSYVLDPEAIHVVDHSGQRLSATLIGFDPETEIAILETEFRPVSWFPLDKTRRSPAGTQILALSNLFNVAVGNEPVSVQSGVISCLGPLNAAQKAMEVPYRGSVYFIDAMSNNPGSNGGALVDTKGRLVGMLGREIQEASGSFWINYALPADVVAQSVQQIQNQASGQIVARQEESDPLQSLQPSDVGITLIPRLTLNTPCYVEWVDQDSAAWKSGLRPDDLILKIHDTLVVNRDQAMELIQKNDRFAPLVLTVRRGDQLKTFTLTP